MSLGRSLTKKGARYGFGSASSSESKRNSIQKTKISSPVALISTTNMLSYTAPPLRNSLSAGSISSSSSSSSTSPTSIMSPLSMSFEENNDLPRNNHLSAYFTTSSAAVPAPMRSQSTRQSKSSKPIGSLSGPRHPSTPPPPAPSQSAARKSAWPPTVQPPKELHSARASTAQQHPFGAELAQVAEMTEEIAGMGVSDAEEEFMMMRGLCRFQASDYEQEIWFGMGGVFEDELPSFGVGWI